MTSRAIVFGCLLLLACAAAARAADPAGFSYEVPAQGSVTVTVHPASSGTLVLPVTAENLRAEDLEYTLTENWEAYSSVVEIELDGDNPSLTYEWPDGALSWPTREDRWFVDTFRVTGPARATIVLPEGAEVIEVKDRECTSQVSTAADKRVTIAFDVPAGKTAREMGVVYKLPWVDTYAVFGKPPTPVYYPKALADHPEYMKRVEHFYESCREFYATYEAKLGWAPGEVKQFLTSWLQGYGGAYCSGSDCYFPFRAVAGFEYPPVTSGGNLIGAYHEVAHAFQPAGYPAFIGGHVWSRFLTMDYDWDVWPTAAEAKARKEAGGSADAEMAAGYARFLELNDQGRVSGLWDSWEDAETAGSIQEAAQAYAMLQISRDLGWHFWGDLARTFTPSPISYGDLPEAVQQKLAVMQMSIAAGRDLTEYLSKLTRSELSVTLDAEAGNVLTGGDMEDGKGWTLDAWQPTARLAWDAEVRFAGTQALRLECPEANDARVTRAAPVEPETCYLLTAWVRTKEVGADAVGANLCLLGAYTRSPDLTGTTDWTRLALLIYSGEAREMTIVLRVGFYGSANTGTAWFDDVELVPLLSEQGRQRLVEMSRPEQQQR